MYKVSTGITSLAVNLLKAQGLDSTGLCHAAGIDLTRLKVPDQFVSRSSLFRLMDLAQQLSGDPDFGLAAYKHFLPGSFQLVGYTMMSSANLLQAFEALLEYSPLLGNGFALGMQPEGNQLRLWGEHFHEPGAPNKCRAAEDMGFASLLGFSRWLTGGRLPRLHEVAFTYPEPENTALHQKLFACDLQFGTRHSSIVFDLAALQAPLSTANEALKLLHCQFAEYRLGQLSDSTWRQQVHTYLLEHISLGICDLDAVAAGMRVNKRTLQRGLSSEGTHFSKTLDEARHQLADYYLRSSSLSLTQVGELLGFQESSSFHKACQRWFGIPPGRFRSAKQ